MRNNAKYKNNNKIQPDRLCVVRYMFGNNYEFKKMKYTKYVEMLFR